MKKNDKKENGFKSLSYGIIVFVLLMVIGIIYICLKPKKTIEVKNESKSYSLGIIDEEKIEEESALFTSYEEFHELFDNTEIKESDFNNNDIVVLKVWYDSCSESDLKLEKYELKESVLNVIVSYTAKCGVCAPSYMYFAVAINKGSDFSEAKIDYQPNNEIHCDPNIAYKPIIYIYPTSVVDVNIKLGYPDYLLVTYPEYDMNGWDVTAYPNGKLIDRKTNRELYSLYWEASNHNQKVSDEGFVVKGSDTVRFLEEKLSILGLSDREANEFIIYWLPKLKDNKYNYIRFETLDEINKYMPLDINPKPNTLIRVLMDYKPLDEPITVNEQVITKVQRNGYTVVEWGGSLIG